MMDRLISDVVINNPKKDNFKKRVKIHQLDDTVSSKASK